MTFKQWLRETWIDIKYGRWTVGRKRMFEPNGKYMYFADHYRSKRMIPCDSKRDAEARCAIENDLRGTGL